MLTKVFCLKLRTNALIAGWLYTILSSLLLAIGVLLIALKKQINDCIVDNYPNIDDDEYLMLQTVLNCEFHQRYDDDDSICFFLL